MSRFRMTCIGVEPLLMHNARLSNPLDQYAKMMKKITSKRTKTEEDYEALARLEYLGSLYYNEEFGPFIPGQNFERCVLDAARITKSGKKIERGVFFPQNVNPIYYNGPREPEILAKDANFRHEGSVKVGTNRVTRTRPCFHEWEVQTEGTYNPAVINLEELRDIATSAGTMIGLGDWRPRFGRFDATVERIDEQ